MTPSQQNIREGTFLTRNWRVPRFIILPFYFILILGDLENWNNFSKKMSVWSPYKDKPLKIDCICRFNKKKVCRNIQRWIGPSLRLNMFFVDVEGGQFSCSVQWRAKLNQKSDRPRPQSVQ